MPSSSLPVVVDGEVFEFLEVGGVARVQRELLPRLCEAEPSLRIRLVTSSVLASPPPRHDRIDHVRVPGLRRVLRPERLLGSAARRLERGWRRQALRPRDATWHATQYATPSRWSGPRVVTVYDTIHEDHPDLWPRPSDDHYRAQKRAAIDGSDAVIAISRHAADRLADRFGADVAARTTVIPLAAATAFSPTGPTAGRARPYLLHVGRRSAHKAFDRLVSAYATWPGRADVDLVTVGWPWQPGEVDDVAVRLAPLDDAGLAALMRGAVALVHPSTVEGYGLPVIEALASDCPVVARRLPVTEEIAGEHPVYADFDDDDAVHAALDRVVDLVDTPDRTAGGVAHAGAYRWDDAAQRTVSLYRSLGG